MVFYRSQRIPIIIKKGSLPGRTFFVWIKVMFEGSVDPNSGMVINLKLVDSVFSELMSQHLEFKSFLDSMKHINNLFKIKSSRLFSGLEISIGKNRLIFQNQKLSGSHMAEILIKENEAYTLRKVEIDFEKLSFAQLKRWNNLQNKKSREEILTAFSQKKSHLLSLRIEYPEWKGWEFFSLH